MLTLISYTLIISLIFLLCFSLKVNKSLRNDIHKLKADSASTEKQKTAFLATASHDLQQPHQALGLFLASINTKKLDNENHQIVSKAKDAHATTSRLLNQLLDISKLDTVETPQMQLVALHELVHSIGLKFLPIAACYGVELRIRQRKAYAKTDPIMLERMLTNILLNAFRHTQKANVLLAIRKKRIKGVLHWNIEIYDNGVGIPDDKQSIIFQEFTKLDPSTNPPSTTGLGLGLAIVKRLSDILGHPVGLRSKLGKGSCFYISLKIEHAQKHLPIEPAVHSVIRQRLKVAVINQDRLLQDSLKTVLVSWGCKVQAFSSSGLVLDAIKSKSCLPDALIVDATSHKIVFNLKDIQDIQSLSRHDVSMILITKEIESSYIKDAERFGFTLLTYPIKAQALREILGDK